MIPKREVYTASSGRFALGINKADYETPQESQKGLQIFNLDKLLTIEIIASYAITYAITICLIKSHKDERNTELPNMQK
jgi:hypothetical protein